MCDEIRIYVADLAAYNNGMLHGVWLDATDEPDTSQEQINTMLENSPIAGAEEYAIHDYEGFGGYAVSEYEGIQAVHEIACFIEEHGKLGGELLNYYGGDIQDAQKAIEEQYHGCFSLLADFAQELTEETTSNIPDNLAFYIDYEKMGRDFEYSGDVFTIETAHDEVHVFWSR